MKRLITCAALLLATAAVFMAVRETTVRAEDEIIEGGALVAIPAGELLREQYVERQRQKALLMTEEELQQALRATDAEIRALNSERRLSEAVKILAEVTVTYANTPAEAVAQNMLHVYKNRGESGGDAPYYGAPGQRSMRPMPDYPAPEYSPAPTPSRPLQPTPDPTPTY